jgi:hypothetical protein
MINPTTHVITEFPVPMATRRRNPYVITTGPDGNLWFTILDLPGSSNGAIGTINRKTHMVTEFPIPTAAIQIEYITAGPDGNLWCTAGGNGISKIEQVVILPDVTGVVSVTHSKKGITVIILGFNEALDSASASDGGFYRLDSGIKKRGKLVYSKAVKIGGVSYDGTAHTVTIRLAKPTKGPVQVMVRGGIKGSNGASSNGDYTAVVR